jgi:hypothetical protein
MVIYAWFLKGKCVYVGQTTNEVVRRSKYKSDVKLKRNYSQLIIRAMVKYGFDSFKWVVLSNCKSHEHLDLEEIRYIKRLKPRYNLSKGGVFRKGKCSKTTRKKISDANKKRLPYQFRVTPIICEQDGNIFVSISEAARYYKIGRTSVDNNVQGIIKTCAGLTFKKINLGHRLTKNIINKP